jgi:hypothetical protein
MGGKTWTFTGRGKIKTEKSEGDKRMKKTIVALLLTLALVGAAVAAPVELEGLLGVEIDYRPDRPELDDLRGTTYLQLGYSSQLNQNAEAVFGLRWQSVGFGSVNDWNEGYLYDTVGTPGTFYAYVDGNGALWEGAQPVKMTMGSINIDYSPYIATVGYKTKLFNPAWEISDGQYLDPMGWIYFNLNGISFDNIKLGAIDTRFFYLFDKGFDWWDIWDLAPSEANTFGINFKGAFDGCDLNATFVKKGEPVAYDIAAALSPVKALDLSGHFLSDGVEEEGWYKFQVAFSGIPNWRFAATYRDFTAPVDFIHRDTTPSKVDGAFVMPNPYALNKGLKGLILNAATSYEGYDFAGEYDYAIRTTQVTASQDNWSAKLKLFYDKDEEDNFVEEVKSLVVLRGNTTGDLASLRNIKFEGVAEFGEKAVYGGSATYVAPNGLNLVAEYFSDDLKDDNGFGWIQDKGLGIRAGYYLNF